MRCKIRRAFALGNADVIESAVPDDIGDMERVPGCGEGDCTGEPREEIDGAEGTWVDIGTDARNSAPDEGASLCLLLLLLRKAVGDCPRLSLSRVPVLGRDCDCDCLSAMTSASPLRSFFLELLKKGTLMLPLRLPGGLFTRSRSRSACRLLRLELLGLSDPPTMVVVVWGVKGPVLFSASALASEAAVERRELGIDGLREIVLEEDREGVAVEARCDRFFSFSRCCSSSLSLWSSAVPCLSLLRQRDVFATGWSALLNTPDRRRSCLELISCNAY